MALNGCVYDLSDFLLQHPEQRNAILAWAGRDATAVWNKIPGRFPSANWMEPLDPDMKRKPTVSEYWDGMSMDLKGY